MIQLTGAAACFVTPMTVLGEKAVLMMELPKSRNIPSSEVSFGISFDASVLLLSPN